MNMRKIWKEGKEFWWTIMIVLVLMNALTWFSQIADENGNIAPLFDTHKLPIMWLAILSFIVMEFVFILFIKNKEKPMPESWANYVARYKFYSFVIASSLFWLLIPLGLTSIKLYEKKEEVFMFLGIILIPILVIGLLSLWIYSNYYLARKLAKEKPRRFTPGQKVKLRTLYSWHGYGGRLVTNKMEKLEKKTVTVKEYLNKNELKIKEDKGKHIWTEEMFE